MLGNYGELLGELDEMLGIMVNKLGEAYINLRKDDTCRCQHFRD